MLGGSGVWNLADQLHDSDRFHAVRNRRRVHHRHAAFDRRAGISREVLRGIQATLCRDVQLPEAARIRGAALSRSALTGRRNRQHQRRR